MCCMLCVQSVNPVVYFTMGWDPEVLGLGLGADQPAEDVFLTATPVARVHSPAHIHRTLTNTASKSNTGYISIMHRSECVEIPSPFLSSMRGCHTRHLLSTRHSERLHTRNGARVVVNSLSL